MKRLIVLLMAFMPMVAFCQKDITTFLGIPIDGSKDSMIHELAKKGFKRAPYGREYDLFGEFNGGDVRISILTYKGKVWRVAVCDDKVTDETDIKIKFNNLVGQFEKNKNYTSLNTGGESYYIDDAEDVSYNISVRKKRYEALFFQNIDLSKVDTLTAQREIRAELVSKYGEDKVINMSEDVVKDAPIFAARYAFQLLEKKKVWFMITEEGYDKYRIYIFYDNEYNRARGDDL